MAALLKKCSSCAAYTLGDLCPKCNAPAGNPHPPKYSVNDPYAHYRRKEKYGE